MTSTQDKRPLCVVTGAGGLVGRHVLPLLAEDWHVVAMTRTPGEPINGVTYRACDLTRGDVADGLPERADAVVHLAQSRRFREFPDGAADVLAVNVSATERMASYAVRAGARHFVLASTGGVYAPASTPLAENAPLLQPAHAGWYAASKLAAEALVHAYRAHFVPIVLRPFFIYGAGQHRDMLIPRLCDSIRDGRPIALAGEHGMILTPTHALDAARAVKRSLALTAPETINVCGPEVLSLRAICESLGEMLGKTPQFTHTAPSAPMFVANNQRMDTMLGVATSRFDANLKSILS